MSSDHTPVTLRREDAVAVLEIDNPPVNAGSAAVRAGLLDGVEQAAADPDVTAVVLIGANRSFISGSDLREFGGSVLEPLLPEVIAAIERCPKPVLAALDGAALGGGLELALACDYRLATPESLLGLPEITFGMVPGAGGTQRLPRLTGAAAAIDLITTGRRISATKGRELRIVDALVEPEALRAAAVTEAARLPGKRRVIDMTVPGDVGEVAAPARDSERREVREAIRLVYLAAGGGNPTDALRDERATFDELRRTPEAAALRHVFFAERRAARVDGLRGTAPRPVRAVGVVGGGTMGAAIATAFLLAGYRVTLAERGQDQLGDGLERVRRFVRQAHDRGKVTDLDATLAELSGTTDLTAMADAALVVEAVFEDVETKVSVLRELESVVGPETVLATNTSYLSVTDLAVRTDRPERVLGLHFFNPAHVMRLVEVVPTAHTSTVALRTALGAVKRLGKQAVVAQDSEGFIGNRIHFQYRRQCELLLEDGALPEQVDRALTDFGFAMGPFAVADLSGLDIARTVRQRRRAVADERERYVEIPDILCESGRLGRKAGAGYYAYPNGKPEPDPAVAELIARHRQTKGATPRDLSDAEIVQRAVYAIVNEAALAVADGAAARPSDVDVVYTLGFGFPRRLGGPLWWAAHQDPADVGAAMTALEEATGFGFRRGPVEDVLAQLLRDDRA